MPLSFVSRGRCFSQCSLLDVPCVLCIHRHYVMKRYPAGCHCYLVNIWCGFPKLSSSSHATHAPIKDVLKDVTDVCHPAWASRMVLDKENSGLAISFSHNLLLLIIIVISMESGNDLRQQIWEKLN